MTQLAVGFKTTQDNGRERITDGYLKHRGLLDAAHVRASGANLPRTGQGVELEWTGAVGYVFAYDRDLPGYADLVIGGKNVSFDVTSLTLPAGCVGASQITDGAVSTADIAANAVQQQLATYLGVPGGTYSGSASWQASAIATSPVACGGGILRIEASINASHNTAGAQWSTGIGWDGALQYGMSLVSAPAANYGQHVSWVYYMPQTVPGTHTFTVYLFNASGVLTLSSNVYSSLYVTEQKR